MTHITCETVQPELKAYFDGETERAQTDSIAAHLESCEVCRRELAEIGLLNREMRTMHGTEDELAPQLKARILASLPDRTETAVNAVSPRFSRNYIYAFGAFATAAVAVALFYPGLHTRSTPQAELMLKSDASKSVAAAPTPGSTATLSSPMADNGMAMARGGGPARTSKPEKASNMTVIAGVAPLTANSTTNIQTQNGSFTSDVVVNSASPERIYAATDTKSALVTLRAVTDRHAVTLASMEARKGDSRSELDCTLTGTPASIDAVLAELIPASHGTVRKAALQRALPSGVTTSQLPSTSYYAANDRPAERYRTTGAAAKAAHVDLRTVTIRLIPQ